LLCEAKQSWRLLLILLIFLIMVMIYPDDRVLVAVVNSPTDWQRVLAEGWYRLPAKHAPPQVPYIDWLAFYFTRAFGGDKWAVHYYSRVIGHELLTRQDMIPTEPNHPRAAEWYYKLILEPPQHKLPPIVADQWRRITFVMTTGDRFEAAREMGDLMLNYSPQGLPYITLKENP